MAKLSRNFGGFISQIVFNNSESLSINENDIVVFVGPNNAGKSQALKDIHRLCYVKEKRIVISNITINCTASKQEIEDFLQLISVISKEGQTTQYRGFGYNFNNYQVMSSGGFEIWGVLTHIFVSYLGTQERLAICNPPQSKNRNAPADHPIHMAADNSEYRQKISSYFMKAFGKNLIPDILFGATVPMRMCDVLTTNYSDKDNDEYSHIEMIKEKLDNFPQIDEQGDGIKSFTGILLNIIIDYRKTFLIDEPESFLHPPQAKIIGHTIGEMLADDQQAFISTHSPEILEGLLEVCPERIKIVRITREGDVNHFSVLNNDEFNNIWKDSLLRHSNIMSGIFHKNVVLCESDSDCRLYSVIYSYMKEERGEYPEALFVHCGGKQRMKRVVSALRALSIPLWVIPDIDILEHYDTLKELVVSAGGNWDILSQKVSSFQAFMRTEKSFINRKDFTDDVLRILNSSQDRNIGAKEIKDIKSMLKTETKWSQLKKGGISNIPPGEPFKTYEDIETELKKLKIFIVPVGELEGFIQTVSGHGPDWVNNVLEQHPNFSDKVYEKLRNFIASWNL